MIDLKLQSTRQNFTTNRQLSQKSKLSLPNHQQTSIKCLNQSSQKFLSFRHGSELMRARQRKSAIQSTQQLNGLNNIIFNMKVKAIRDIFINKLNRFHYSNQVQPVNIKRIQHILSIKGIQFSQKTQHFVIGAFLLVNIILMVLTSFESTLTQFSQKVQNSASVTALRFMCLLILIAHFGLHSFGNTFKNGQYLQYATQILQIYLHSISGIIDLITIILLILLMIFPQSRALSILLFAALICQFLRAVSQLISLQAAYIHSRKWSMVWRLFKIVIFNLILAHIVATILLGIRYLEPEHSWTVKYGIEGSQWYVYYITAYYWGTIIVTTIGFGDISCGNWRESVIISIIVMFTSIILGFNLSEFNNIFSNLRAASQKITRNKVIFKRMIIRDENNNATINPSLKKQIYKFIEDEGLDKGDIQFTERNQFISSLPQYLRKSYLKAANRKIFIQVYFFNRLKHQTLVLICNEFKNYFLFPQQQIYDPTNKINILEQGNVGFIYKKKGSTINGLIFDQIQVSKKQNLLLLNSDFLSLIKETNYGFYGKTCSIIWSIGIDQFIDVLRSDYIDFQYYFNILHKHPLDTDQWQVKTCSRCTSRNRLIRHSVFRCPQISYIPLHNMIVYRYLYNIHYIQQQRKKFHRYKDSYLKISVLKYYKNYFETLVYQKIRLDNENNYLSNFFPQKSHQNNVKNLHFVPSEISIKYYDPNKNILHVDSPQNFDYYFPNYNISRFHSSSINLPSSNTSIHTNTILKLHPNHIN